MVPVVVGEPQVTTKRRVHTGTTCARTCVCTHDTPPRHHATTDHSGEKMTIWQSLEDIYHKYTHV